MRDYSPRRQSKRWLDGDCPREILAIYYDKREPCDPYTIIYAEPDKDDRDYWFTYAGLSEDGMGYHGQLRRHEMQGFRDRNKNRARKWSEVHAPVRGWILADIRSWGTEVTS